MLRYRRGSNDPEYADHRRLGGIQGPTVNRLDSSARDASPIVSVDPQRLNWLDCRSMRPRRLNVDYSGTENAVRRPRRLYDKRTDCQVSPDYRVCFAVA